MSAVYALKFFPGHCAMCAAFDHLVPVEAAETPLEREGLVFLCGKCVQKHLRRQWQAALQSQIT